MRLRNVKGSREMIATNDFVVHEEETMKGKWHDFFENENPIHIEVGMGKGRFIIDMAKLHPEINYIGIRNIRVCLSGQSRSRQSSSFRIWCLSEWMRRQSKMYLKKMRLPISI